MTITAGTHLVRLLAAPPAPNTGHNGSSHVGIWVLVLIAVAIVVMGGYMLFRARNK